MVNFYIIIDGSQQGPFTIAELSKKNITQTTKLWAEGMENWEEARNIEALKDILKTIPPSIPEEEKKKIKIEAIISKTPKKKREHINWKGIYKVILSEIKTNIKITSYALILILVSYIGIYIYFNGLTNFYIAYKYKNHLLKYKKAYIEYEKRYTIYDNINELVESEKEKLKKFQEETIKENDLEYHIINKIKKENPQKTNSQMKKKESLILTIGEFSWIQENKRLNKLYEDNDKNIEGELDKEKMQKYKPKLYKKIDQIEKSAERHKAFINNPSNSIKKIHINNFYGYEIKNRIRLDYGEFEEFYNFDNDERNIFVNLYDYYTKTGKSPNIKIHTKRELDSIEKRIIVLEKKTKSLYIEEEKQPFFKEKEVLYRKSLGLGAVSLNSVEKRIEWHEKQYKNLLIASILPAIYAYLIEVLLLIFGRYIYKTIKWSISKHKELIA